MKTKKWIALGLFALAVCANLLGNYLEIDLLQRISKPVLMPLLLLNALLALSQTAAPKWLGAFLMLALCFHCGGDIFLMLSGFPFFVAGLLCFLIGHVFYILIFSRTGLFKNGSNFWNIATIFVATGIPLILVFALGFEGPIKYAVLIYAEVLLFVSLSGLWGVFNKKSGVASPNWWLTFAGGLIFIFSDFLVAWRSLLGHSFPHMGFVIMFTYILAECLIVASIVRPYLPRK